MLGVQANRRRGAVAIETALMFPLLVLLIFGMVEFGLLLYNRQVLTNASREGARFGILLGSPSHTGAEIRGVVNNYCTNRLVTFGSAAAPAVTVEREGTDCTSDACCNPNGITGDDLMVRVSYQYDFLVLTNFGFGPINLVAQTVMKCE